MPVGSRSFTPPFLAIAGLTVREGRQRPALPVAIGILGVALVASPSLIFFGFGREAAIVEDMGVSSLRLAALLAAVLCGAATVARDRADGGRLLVFLARPLTPAGWLLGRWLGTLGLAVAAILILSVPFALALKQANGPAAVAGDAAVRAAVAAPALAAVAIACGTLFPAGAAALATFVVFALGHLRPRIEGLARSAPARALLAALVPDLTLGGGTGADGAGGGARLAAGLAEGALATAVWLGFAAAVAEAREIR